MCVCQYRKTVSWRSMHASTTNTRYMTGSFHATHSNVDSNQTILPISKRPDVPQSPHGSDRKIGGEHLAHPHTHTHTHCLIFSPKTLFWESAFPAGQMIRTPCSTFLNATKFAQLPHNDNPLLVYTKLHMFLIYQNLRGFQWKHLCHADAALLALFEILSRTNCTI